MLDARAVHKGRAQGQAPGGLSLSARARRPGPASPAAQSRCLSQQQASWGAGQAGGRAEAGMGQPSFLKTGFKKSAGTDRSRMPGRGREAELMKSRPSPGRPGAGGLLRWAVHKGRVRGQDAGGRVQGQVPVGLSLSACALPRPAAQSCCPSQQQVSWGAGQASGRAEAGESWPSFLKTGFKKKVPGPAGGRMPGAEADRPSS